MSDPQTQIALILEADQFFLTTSADKMEFPRPSDDAVAYFGLRVHADHADRVILRRGDWLKRTPYRLQSRRLEIRPLQDTDYDAFHKIAGQISVARMLVNLENPLSRDASDHWIHRRRYVGRLGFMIGIFDHENRLLGSIGIGGLSNSLVYFLSEDARGTGIGTEAVSLFVDDAIARFALKSIFAGVFTDNPVSRILLEKLGFRVTGTSDFKSPARSAIDNIWEMERIAKGD